MPDTCAEHVFYQRGGILWWNHLHTISRDVLRRKEWKVKNRRPLSKSEYLPDNWWRHTSKVLPPKRVFANSFFRLNIPHFVADTHSAGGLSLLQTPWKTGRPRPSSVSNSSASCTRTAQLRTSVSSSPTRRSSARCGKSSRWASKDRGWRMELILGTSDGESSYHLLA